MKRQLISIERALLRALCHGAALSELPSQARSELQNYAWQGADHQTIFAALTRIGSVGGHLLRETLAAEATRMGFPDINWSDYFEPPVAGAGEMRGALMELVRELKALTAQTR